MTAPFIMTRTEIDTVQDIEKYLAAGNLDLPAWQIESYLHLLVRCLKGQAGETKRVLNESAESFKMATDQINSLRDRLWHATNGAEGEKKD
jgi:hypothetical protein